MDILAAISEERVNYSNVIIFVLTKKRLKKVNKLVEESISAMEALHREAIGYIGPLSSRGFESGMHSDKYSRELNQYADPRYVTVVAYMGRFTWTYLVLDVTITMLLFSGISNKTRKIIASALVKIGKGEPICEKL